MVPSSHEYSEDDGSAHATLGGVATGTTYRGSRNEKGQRDGEGNWAHPDGRTYTGQWKDGRRHGKGCFKYANGTVYDGGYEHGLRHGIGAYDGPDGRYVGQWHKGFMQGTGRWTRRAGGSQDEDGHAVVEYHGCWIRGQRHGHGTAHYADGTSYVGEWQDGRQHGQGALSRGLDVLYDGSWRHGERQPGVRYRLWLAWGNVLWAALALVVALLLATFPLVLFAPVPAT